LRLHVDQIDALDAAIAKIDAQVGAKLAPFRAAVEQVISIPGIKKVGAEVILLKDRHRHEPVSFRSPPPVMGVSVSAQR
jgi:transposase